ncbi:hypothetical protein VB002_14205 [Campylobacter concisus]
MLVIFYRASIERKLPKLQTSDVNTAIRGNIVTKDGFSISSSQKLYKVMLDTRNIDPNKKRCSSSSTRFTAATIQTK